MKHLSNIELDQEFAVAVKTERKITHEVLLYIQEIHRRSLHVSFGYDSLRDYLIKRHKYSEGAAWRRINAMQMLTAVPEVKEKIIEGSLNLSQLAITQSAIYQKQKEEKCQVSNEEKANLLLKLENRTLDKTKAEIANSLNIEIKEKKPITYGKDDTAFINMKLTKEELTIVQETLNLMSHQAKNPKELLLNFCKKALKAKKELKPQKGLKMNSPLKSDKEVKSEIENIKSTKVTNEQILTTGVKSITPSASATKSQRGRYIPELIRTQVFIRDQFKCQFRGESGHVCGSKRFLQPHHIKAFAKGGEHKLENLSLRCRAHNLFEAEREGLGRPA